MRVLILYKYENAVIIYDVDNITLSNGIYTIEGIDGSIWRVNKEEVDNIIIKC